MARSSKRRPGSATAHRCSFFCITSTRYSASSRSGHGSPVFTDALPDQLRCCEHAGPLRHVTGFPGPGLLRVLRPIPAASTGDGPSRRPAGCWPGRGPPGWFPRSPSNRLTGSAPNYAPATSPRLRRRHSPWPPDRRHQPAKEFPARRRRAGARCSPALIYQVRAGGSLEGRSTVGSSRTPSRPASRTQTIWQCWPVPSLSGLLPPSPSSQGSGCPQLLPARCDEPEAVSFHHRTVQQRLVALDVGDP